MACRPERPRHPRSRDGRPEDQPGRSRDAVFSRSPVAHIVPHEPAQPRKRQQQHHYARPAQAHVGAHLLVGAGVAYVLGEADPVRIVVLEQTASGKGGHEPLNPDLFVQAHDAGVSADNALVENPAGKLLKLLLLQRLQVATANLGRLGDAEKGYAAILALLPQIVPELSHAVVPSRKKQQTQGIFKHDTTRKCCRSKEYSGPHREEQRCSAEPARAREVRAAKSSFVRLKRVLSGEPNKLNKLVVGNLLHRPLRTLISMFAVAIEVIMILSIVAIMFGMLNGSKNRTSGVGMDIIVSPSGTTMFNGVGGAPAPIKIADTLRKQPHVRAVSPVIIQLTSASSLENIYGIDFESFNALKPFVFISGGPFRGPYDVIIDDIAAKADHGHRVGETMNIIKHDFHICGIVEHGKGGRKFVPIGTLGELTGAEGKASVFYVKSDDLANQNLIRAEIQAIPGFNGAYEVRTLDELMSQMTPEHIPAFSAGLYTVITIAVVIGFLVIFQSMYTAVMERTREIGILKSLGASQGYIVNVVLRETALISVVGILLGVALTFVLKTGVHLRYATIDFLITGPWIVRGAIIAFVGAMLGAAYPAVKAARKDPIDALAYE